jgi:hypothetical protein
MPAQAELGMMWHADEISVAEEHFVSPTTRKVIAQVMARAPRLPTKGKTMFRPTDLRFSPVGDWGWELA